MKHRDAPVQGFLIPDLCSPQAVLFLLLISVLLALILVLFAGGLARFDWIALGRTSLFVLWNTLPSAALLCALRARIARWPLVRGATLAYAVVLAVCALSSLTAQWLLEQLGAGRFEPARFGRDLLIGALLGGVALRYFHLQGELLKRERSELSARIQSLQARIRPHFLFNSMNIIASLIPLAPEQAEGAVEDLAELFRASLREGETTVPLAEELELCERYLRLEALRLGDRLRVHRRIAALPAGARVPALCVQPLLENAVYHGIQPLPDGGSIDFEVACRNGELWIEVRNPLPPLARSGSPGSGMALDNIRARLAAIYAGRAGLEVERADGSFRARLHLPLEAPQ